MGYVPLAYFLGFIAEKLMSGKNKKEAGGMAESVENINNNKAVLLTNNQIALVNYIREARASGMGDGQISGVLKDNGWSDEDIKKAFSLC